MNLFDGPGSDCGHCICGVSFSLGGYFDARWSHTDGFDYCCRECADGGCMCSVVESTLVLPASPRLDAMLERLERPLTTGGTA